MFYKSFKEEGRDVIIAGDAEVPKNHHQGMLVHAVLKTEVDFERLYP